MTTADHPRDSGTQPTPHYCTQRVADDGTVVGCPDWPLCLFPTSPATFAAARRAGWRRAGHDLAILGAWAAGALIVIIAAVVLIPLASS